MTITDEQIKQILDLTAHAPTGDRYPRDQREGMDTFLGTDEEMIARVRVIINEDEISVKDLVLDYVKKVLLDPEFVSTLAKALYDTPISTACSTRISQPESEIKPINPAAAIHKDCGNGN